MPFCCVKSSEKLNAGVVHRAPSMHLKCDSEISVDCDEDNSVYIFINWHVILTVPDSNLQLQGSWRFQSGTALVLSSSQLLLRGSVGFVMHRVGLHCVRCNQVFRSANFTAVGVERNT